MNDYIEAVYSNLIERGVSSIDATTAISEFKLKDKIKECKYIHLHLGPEIVANLVLDNYYKEIE